MAVAPPSYDIAERARNLANIKYTGAINQANRDRTVAGSLNQAAIDTLTGMRDTGVQGVNQAYDILDQNLKTSYADRERDYAGVQRDLAASWQGARDYTALARDDAQNYLNNLAQNLGTVPGAAVVETSNPIQALAARQLADLAQYENSRAGSFSQQNQQYLNWNRMMQENAGRQRASSVSGFLSQLAADMAKAQMQRTTQDYQLGGKIRDLESERGAFEVESNYEGADRQFQQLQAYNDDLLAEAELAQRAMIAQAQIDADRAKTQAQLDRAAQDDALDWAKFEESKRQFGLGHGLDQSADKRAWFEAMQSANQPAELKQYMGDLGLQMAAADLGITGNERAFLQDVQGRVDNAIMNASRNGEDIPNADVLFRQYMPVVGQEYMNRAGPVAQYGRIGVSNEQAAQQWNQKNNPALNPAVQRYLQVMNDNGRWYG